ncbi:MAG: 16S rRNA (guanine(966)-N(2))-methyltransferase RsmD [Bacteroidetes bacterium]|nr:16S rRNA (guanine(966)-N(2))-methyltransferase RsmD [Bacteroidota bacterium]
MRIIGGIHGGKALLAPKNLPTRPTTDFAKEGLFNILNNRIEFEGKTVLDLFAGTGNISLEFASRGASRVLSIDSHFACVKYIKEMARQLDLQTVLTEKADVFKFMAGHQASYDIIFADPPYDLSNIADIHQLVFDKKLLNEDGLLIIEHGPRTKLEDKAGFTEHRKYGNVNFSFFSLKG